VASRFEAFFSATSGQDLWTPSPFSQVQILLQVFFCCCEFIARTVVARDFSFVHTEFGLVPRFLLTMIFAATGILLRRGLPRPGCRRQKPSCVHSSSPDPVLLPLFCFVAGFPCSRSLGLPVRFLFSFCFSASLIAARTGFWKSSQLLSLIST
jgi:hypothetical protein